MRTLEIVFSTIVTGIALAGLAVATSSIRWR